MIAHDNCDFQRKNMSCKVIDSKWICQEQLYASSLQNASAFWLMKVILKMLLKGIVVFYHQERNMFVQKLHHSNKWNQ